MALANNVTQQGYSPPRNLKRRTALVPAPPKITTTTITTQTLESKPLEENCDEVYETMKKAKLAGNTAAYEALFGYARLLNSEKDVLRRSSQPYTTKC